MLARVKGHIVHMVLSRVSPLAVPVLLEIGRESVRTDSDEDALLAEAEAIIAEATGSAEPPPRPGDPPRQRRPPPGRHARLPLVAPGAAQVPAARPVLVTAAPVHLAGERLMLDPMGALYWPATRLLAVSDLHLEKGSSFARRGMLLPPWDTHATLDRLTCCCAAGRRQTVVALGDSFHDSNGSAPASGHRAATAERHDRGASFHLGPGQPRSAPARGRWRRSGWKLRHRTDGVSPSGRCVRRIPARSSVITTRRRRFRPAPAPSAAPASWPTAAADAAGVRRLYWRP